MNRTTTMSEARKPETGKPETLQSLTIGLAGEVFAIPVMVVRDILDPLPVTAVPTARQFVNGLINVRGRVVPLVDLRLKLGLPPAETTKDSRFVVIETDIDGENVIVALRTDKVYEVGDVEFVDGEEAPRIGMRWNPELLHGIGRRNNRFIMILDLGRVFASIEPTDF
ncbi:Chemotaxis protein CheW [uncultured Gammaproteobacteria bacterium]